VFLSVQAQVMNGNVDVLGNEEKTTVQRRLQTKMGQELTGQYSSNKLSSCGSWQRARVSVRAKVADRSRRGVTRLRARRQVGRRPSVSLAQKRIDREGY
jgi:beta-glucanase (GH16 family)